MTHQITAKSFKQKINGFEFYCELRGSGPTIALIPGGVGDCGSYAKVADMLASEFTVFTYDMRYCSRSERPAVMSPITPGILADDTAELIKALGLAPVTFYGSSSGGQCVLSLGVYYPELCRNLLVHEAALLGDTPPGSGVTFLKEQVDLMVQLTGSKDSLFKVMGPAMSGDAQAWAALDPEFHKRIGENGGVWIDFMLEQVSARVYTDNELANLPPTVFSVGLTQAGWLVYANIKTAQRAKAELVWLPGTHYPQVSHPDALTHHIRLNTLKYVR
jgi:pimeloyl-ACP methyl ester carboxylesterase